MSILSSVRRTLQEMSNNSSSTNLSNYDNSDFGKIKFSSALLKNFIPIGMGLYKQATDDDDYGKIWIKKTIVDEKTGTAEDWLVVYTTEEDEIIRQVANEKFQEIFGSKITKSAHKLKKKSMDFSVYEKYPEYRKYFTELLRLLNFPYSYSEQTLLDKGVDFLMKKFPDLDPVEANKIFNIWIGEFNPFDDELVTASNIDPKNIPIAPGIKSKDLKLNETGGGGGGTVTIEFTDPQHALDFYQKKVTPQNGQEEAPKEEGGAPPSQLEPTQQTPPPFLQQQVQKPQVQQQKASKKLSSDNDVAEDMYGQLLFEGDRVKDSYGRIGIITKIVDRDVVYVKWGESAEEQQMDTKPLPISTSSLVKWSNLKPTVFEFTDGVKGIKVYKHTSSNVNIPRGDTWKIALSNLSSNTPSFIDGYFINEDGAKVSIRLSSKIKVGEMLERPDTHDLVRFAGWIDKISDKNKSNTLDEFTNELSKKQRRNKSKAGADMALYLDDEQYKRGMDVRDDEKLNSLAEVFASSIGSDNYYDVDNEFKVFVDSFELSPEEASYIAGYLESVYNLYQIKDVFLSKFSSANSSLDIHIDADEELIDNFLEKVLEEFKETPDETDRLEGGLADDIPDEAFDEDSLEEGIEVEKEHTDDEEIAKEIAKDHLIEDEDYYDKLKKMEEDDSKEDDSKEDDLDKKSSIVLKKNKWYVVSEKGKNLGGPYDTKEEASKRLKQVEYFKHKKEKKSSMNKESDHYLDPNFGLWVASFSRYLPDNLLKQYRKILSEFLPENKEYIKIVRDVGKLDLYTKKKLEEKLYDLIEGDERLKDLLKVAGDVADSVSPMSWVKNRNSDQTKVPSALPPNPPNPNLENAIDDVIYDSEKAKDEKGIFQIVTNPDEKEVVVKFIDEGDKLDNFLKQKNKQNPLQSDFQSQNKSFEDLNSPVQF